MNDFMKKFKHIIKYNKLNNRYKEYLRCDIEYLYYFSFKYIDIEKRLKVINELINNKRYDLALAYSEDSIGKNPDNFDIALKRAFVLEEIADVTNDKRAYMDLAKSLEYILIINPYYKRAYDKLEKIYEMTGEENLIRDLKYRKKIYIQADK